MRDRGRAEEGEIFSTAQKAGSRQTIMVFVGFEWSLASASGYCDLGVEGFIILTQLSRHRAIGIPFLAVVNIASTDYLTMDEAVFVDTCVKRKPICRVVAASAASKT